jgi:hypothetical protein
MSQRVIIDDAIHDCTRQRPSGVSWAARRFPQCVANPSLSCFAMPVPMMVEMNFSAISTLSQLIDTVTAKNLAGDFDAGEYDPIRWL